MRQGGRIAYPQNINYYKVTIQRLICSGKHVITFKFGGAELEHDLFVVGKPRYGVQVTEGPDWKEMASKHRINLIHSTAQSDKEIGTVCELREHYDPYTYNRRDIQKTDKVKVQFGTFGVRSYKWGRDDEYKIDY